MAPNTLDIASDSFETLGECLVVEGLPDDYIRLPDSRSEGQATLESVIERDDRCQYCGDHRYTHGGCSKCEDTVSSDLDQSTAPETPQH